MLFYHQKSLRKAAMEDRNQIVNRRENNSNNETRNENNSSDFVEIE